MIVNGHSWLSIQQYSLAEIGIFFKVIIETEKEDRRNNLIYSWMSSNLSDKGIKEALSKMDTQVKPKEPSAKEVKSEWKRLASFMKGVK